MTQIAAKSIVASVMAGLCGVGLAGATEPQPADPDARQVISLNAAQRHHVLEEMREFLTATQGIVEGLADGDREWAAEAARAAGPKGPGGGGGRALRMREVLPTEFHQLGQSTRQQFLAIAELAESDASDEELLGALSANLATCNACHGVYRINQQD